MVANGHFPQLNDIIQYMETYKDRKESRASQDFLIDIPTPGMPQPMAVPLPSSNTPDGQEANDANGNDIEDDDEEDISDLMDAASARASQAGKKKKKKGQEEEEDDESKEELQLDDDNDNENDDSVEVDNTINEDDENDDMNNEEDGNSSSSTSSSPPVIPDRPLTEKELKKARKQEAKQARIDARKAAKVAKREADAANSIDRSMRRQTFLFSATLMLPETGRENAQKKKKVGGLEDWPHCRCSIWWSMVNE